MWCLYLYSWNGHLPEPPLVACHLENLEPTGWGCPVHHCVLASPGVGGELYWMPCLSLGALHRSVRLGWGLAFARSWMVLCIIEILMTVKSFGSLNPVICYNLLITLSVVIVRCNLKACLDGMILSAWQNHTWFCHVWFFCLDGITMSCVISFNSKENWLGTLSYLIMLYICCIAIAKYMC